MPPETPRTSASAQLRSAIDHALVQHDRRTAVSAAVEAVIEGRLGVPELYTDVLVPLLVDTGAAWQRGTTAVWEEHYASSIVRTIVESLYLHVAEKASATAPLGKTILLTCPAEETHDLGLRMLADRLALAGWTVHFLGADTPTADIVEAARTLEADVVALSAATHFNRVQLHGVLSRLRAELPGVRIGVGGPAFAAGDVAPSDRLTEADLGLASGEGA